MISGPLSYRVFRETGPCSRHHVRPSYGDFLNSFAMKARAGPYGSYNKWHFSSSVRLDISKVSAELIYVSKFKKKTRCHSFNFDAKKLLRTGTFLHVYTFAFDLHASAFTCMDVPTATGIYIHVTCIHLHLHASTFSIEMNAVGYK